MLDKPDKLLDDRRSTLPQPLADRQSLGVPLHRLIRYSLTADTVIDRPQAFKALAATLQGHPDEPHILAVASATGGEGRTTVALQLSLALRRLAPEQVLLIEGDLRRPTLASSVRPTPQLGLAEILSGQARTADAVLPLEDGRWHLLPAGGRSRDPIELFAARRFREVMSNLRKRFRWILIDTPPAHLYQDAEVIGAATDGMLMVASAGTSRDAFAEAVDSLTSAPILGLIRNSFRPGRCG